MGWSGDYRFSLTDENLHLDQLNTIYKFLGQKIDTGGLQSIHMDIITMTQ